MRTVVVTVLAGMMLAPFASAQKLELKLDAIADKESDKAEVDMDRAILKLALPQALSKKDKDGKSPVSDLLSGVRRSTCGTMSSRRRGAIRTKSWSRCANR